ncbi:glycine, alanine and asparagine-rich like protein [Babesia caballi]|uniref:Glycine, alanine and asparagine-rich like protein n=1 Tax=Babesia caballi TaxID=5871 RepID=A0AAV4LY09_BABCB|nr:glycine, alanine and asparagine-rich like protein [Babesia caballi]
MSAAVQQALGPGEVSLGYVGPSNPQVVSLCNVDLKRLLEEEETTCSPFSEPTGVKNSESMFSDDPNYLWYVKQRADMLRGPSVSSRGQRRRQGSDLGSDVSSTCVMVNIKHDTCVNLCDNPSDMWHGLKMSDGTPVVIRSRRARVKRSGGKRSRSTGANGTAASGKGADVAAADTQQGGRAGTPAGGMGPINYRSGFLSLQNYVGRGDGASTIYRIMRVDARSAHRSRRTEIRVRQRRQRVQQHLAKARGVAF